MAVGYDDGSQGQIGTQAAMGACAVSMHLCNCMICLQVQMWHWEPVIRYGASSVQLQRLALSVRNSVGAWQGPGLTPNV